MCRKILLVGLLLFTLLSALVSSSKIATKGNDLIINVDVRMKTVFYLFLIVLTIKVIFD